MPDQLRRIGRSCGWDARARQDRGSSCKNGRHTQRIPSSRRPALAPNNHNTPHTRRSPQSSCMFNFWKCVVAHAEGRAASVASAAPRACASRAREEHRRCNANVTAVFPVDAVPWPSGWPSEDRRNWWPRGWVAATARAEHTLRTALAPRPDNSPDRIRHRIRHSVPMPHSRP